jgi:hypothetical protein
MAVVDVVAITSGDDGDDDTPLGMLRRKAATLKVGAETEVLPSGTALKAGSGATRVVKRRRSSASTGASPQRRVLQRDGSASSQPSVPPVYSDPYASGGSGGEPHDSDDSKTSSQGLRGGLLAAFGGSAEADLAAGAPPAPKASDEVLGGDVFGPEQIKAMTTDEYLRFMAELDTDSADPTKKMIEVFKSSETVGHEAEQAANKYIKWLETISVDGKHAAGGNAYQAFTRQRKADPALAEQYDAASKSTHSSDAKRKIREEFCRIKYAHELKQKRYYNSFATVDTTLGVYMNFGQAVVHYGGWSWPGAARCTRIAFAKCLRLRGKWVNFDWQSDTLECLILSRQHSDVLEQKWTLYEQQSTEEHQRTQALAGANPPASIDAAADGTAITTGGKSQGHKGKGKGKEKGKTNKEGKPKGADPPRGDDDDVKKLGKVLKEASRVKDLLLKSRGSSATLLARLQNDDPEFENISQKAKEKLIAAKVAVESGLDEFGNTFLLTDVAALKKKHAAKFLMTPLSV